ncbi:MAG: hypothetical protein ISS76_22820 [Phycisphaerae bacterium]|nr:hypothetical protein [Phycisphaerae bacterium]
MKTQNEHARELVCAMWAERIAQKKGDPQKVAAKPIGAFRALQEKGTLGWRYMR